MGLYNKEINIVEYLTTFEETMLFVNEEDKKEIIKILDDILDFDIFKSKWKDNSNSQFPPDFINEKDKIMMEVMRVDDHSKDGKKNPVLEKEYLIEKEILKKCPNLKEMNLQFIVNTDLPTEKDHNYSNYINSFKRTITKHKNKIYNYKRNYPNYKLIFLVFDETSGIYIQPSKNNTFTLKQIHLFDLNIIELFNISNVDLVIWFHPYFQSEVFYAGIPDISIFQPSAISNTSIFKRFDIKKVISNEL